MKGLIYKSKGGKKVLTIIVSFLSKVYALVGFLRSEQDICDVYDELCYKEGIESTEEDKEYLRQKNRNDRMALFILMDGCIFFICKPLVAALMMDFGVYPIFEPFCDVIAEWLFNYIFK